jgi:hypothetical protein
VQALLPPEPLAPQLWDGVIDASTCHKPHIVQFNQAVAMAAPKHHQKQQLSFGAKHRPGQGL